MDGVILTEEALRREVEYFLTQDAFAWDTETMDGVDPDTRGRPERNQVVWLSLATYGRTIVIPMGHPNGDLLIQKAHRKKNKETGIFENFPFIYSSPPRQLLPSVVWETVRPLFFSPSIKKIAHNAPFDMVSVAKYFGEVPCGPVVDTIVYQWLIDENIGEFSSGPSRPSKKALKVLIKWYYGVDYDREEVGKCIENHPFTKVARYSLLDAGYTWLLYLLLDALVSKKNLGQIRDLENEVTEVCSYMRLTGAHIDIPGAEREREALKTDLEKAEADVYRAAGKVFNLNSAPQKQDILFGLKKDGNQGLKPSRFTKGKAPSTDKEALDEHAGNRVVDALLVYAEINKILSTYINGYLGDPDNPDKTPIAYNNRIHTDLVQYGTVTGRFSSREPNLQNIPAPRSDLGKRIRSLFTAPEGHMLLVADYAQMELRILASYIGHGGLYDGFMAGIDAHTQTAALVFGVDIGSVEKYMRDAAKTLNFAIVYGAGAKKVASMLKISLKEAQKLLKDHRKAFPEIYKFKDTVVKTASGRKVPHIRTILNRERRVWDLRYYQEEWQLWRAQRQVVNSLIQGSLGDIIKLAMVRLYRVLLEDARKNPGKEIKMVLSVHDELVLEAPQDRTGEAAAILLEAMTGKEIQDLIGVPLDVGKVSIVHNWAEAKA